MTFLIIIHVLSAIIGVGPTFFSHVLLRNNQSLEELRASLKMAHRLELFPKIGGSIALITGLLLVMIGNYGKFAQLWIIGSLVAYALIQIIVIAVISPRQKKLTGWVLDIAHRNEKTLPDVQSKLFVKVSNLYYGPTALGVILFIMMIVRPS
jgi:uncharacterized membrane protein